jgi:hypothetical protein
MKKLWLTIVLFVAGLVASAQINKDDISIVQFSAEFVKANEISLDDFKNYNVQTLYMEKHQKLFAKEKIKSLPTVILYSDGEIVYKIDGGISMKLPTECKEEIKYHIEEILRSRF